MADTLQFVATDSTMQSLAVILQGVFLIIGALTTLFSRKK